LKEWRKLRRQRKGRGKRKRRRLKRRLKEYYRRCRRKGIKSREYRSEKLRNWRGN
jgi:hypothetical protein